MRILISFSKAACNSLIVHFRLLCSLARFLRVGADSLPKIFGTKSIPYETLGTLSDDRPLVWFSLRPYNSCRLDKSFEGADTYV